MPRRPHPAAARTVPFYRRPFRGLGPAPAPDCAPSRRRARPSPRVFGRAARAAVGSERRRPAPVPQAGVPPPHSRRAAPAGRTCRARRPAAPAPPPPAPPRPAPRRTPRPEEAARQAAAEGGWWHGGAAAATLTVALSELGRSSERGGPRTPGGTPRGVTRGGGRGPGCPARTSGERQGERGGRQRPELPAGQAGRPRRTWRRRGRAGPREQTRRLQRRRRCRSRRCSLPRRRLGSSPGR